MASREGKLVIALPAQQYNMMFWNKEKQIGILSWGDGVMKFEGDAKESAEKLFDFLKPYMDEYIREKVKAGLAATESLIKEVKDGKAEGNQE